MSIPTSNFPENRAAIHYRNTDYSTGGSNRTEHEHGNRYHGRSVFSERRPNNNYHQHHQYDQPVTMSQKVGSIVNTWNRLTGKFADLFSGATTKKEIRQTKREAKAELREKFRSGEISRKEYRALKKQLRKAKRAAKRAL